jgi:hypothetical protein
MAERAAVVKDRIGNFVVVEWSGLLNGDTGAPVDWSEYADRSVQLSGTLGVGGNCRIEGSNDPDTATTYATLNDAGGTALDMAALKIEQVLESTRWIRPNITAGDGSTALVVRMFARKGNR